MDRNIWSVCRGQPSSLYTHLNACVEIAVAFKDPLAVVPAILHHSKHSFPHCLSGPGLSWSMKQLLMETWQLKLISSYWIH